jgi:anti-sigma regulatory factor (Ser/Thr protein kinase)
VAVQHAAPGSDSSPDPEPRAPALTAPASVSHSLPATADSVGRLRRAVTDFARGHGASERALDSVNLAVSEALTNVVLHAYRDASGPGPLLLVVAVRDRVLVVTVADEGCGMTPRSDSPGLGLGLGLMTRLADTFEIAPRAARPGVVLRMAFSLVA